MRIRDIALVVTVAFLWAICFPLIEVGLEGAPPLVFATMRAALSGGLLIIAAAGLKRPWPRGFVRHGLIPAAGLSFTALGFGGMFLGGGKISPGLATVLANTQPLIAAVLAIVFLSERLTPRLGAGLLLGFAGVAVMSLPSLSGPDHVAGMQAFLWITLGAVGTAVGNVLLKALAGQGDILVITGLQLLVGAVALALGVRVMDQDWQIAWTARFVASLAGLAVFGTAIMIVIWYYLLHRLPLNRLNPFTFLTPVFGLLLGGLFFGERLGVIEGAGILVTVFAIQLVATRGNTHAGWVDPA